MYVHFNGESSLLFSFPPHKVAAASSRRHFHTRLKASRERLVFIPVISATEQSLGLARGGGGGAGPPGMTQG